MWSSVSIDRQDEMTSHSSLVDFQQLPFFLLLDQYVYLKEIKLA